jgi:hypothetical protein
MTLDGWLPFGLVLPKSKSSYWLLAACVHVLIYTYMQIYRTGSVVLGSQQKYVSDEDKIIKVKVPMNITDVLFKRLK